jgi:CDP-glucose 4,6-dehydratase
MTLLLERFGIEVVGYSLAPTDLSLFNRLNRKGKITEVFEDIRDLNSLSKFFAQTKPALVLHMAAQPLVLESYFRTRETFEVNVIGTVNVIDVAFQTNSVKVIGVITTDKVYRNQETGRKFVESDALEGKDPYSASKVAAESVVRSWINIQEISGGPRLISLRAGNVIGGGDFAENRIMPDLIRGLVMGKETAIRNPESTRPWQHVLDPLLGYLAAISQGLIAENKNAYNFGPEEESFSVSELIRIVEGNFPGKFNIEVKAGDETRKMESKFLGLDSELANSTLGWCPAWSQEEAIISTVNWWIHTLDGKDSGSEICAHDINQLLKFHNIEIE